MNDPVTVVAHVEKVDDLDGLRTHVQKRAADLGRECVWREIRKARLAGGEAREALKDGSSLVLVCGGDGTVRTAADALVGTDAALGILPAGTGNLLARNLGLPMDLLEAADVALTGRTVALDVGRWKGPKDPKGASGHFLVMAGVGLDAAMIERTPDGMKDRLGWPAYVVAATRSLGSDPFRARLRVDDATLDVEARSILVGNVGRLQAGLRLLPDAEPDDGLLDVVVIAPETTADWVRVAWRVAAGRDTEDRRLIRLRGSRVDVEAATKVPRQIDGDEMKPGRRLKVRTHAGALNVRVPVEEES